MNTACWECRQELLISWLKIACKVCAHLHFLQGFQPLSQGSSPCPKHCHSCPDGFGIYTELDFFSTQSYLSMKRSVSRKPLLDHYLEAPRSRVLKPHHSVPRCFLTHRGRAMGPSAGWALGELCAQGFQPRNPFLK